MKRTCCLLMLTILMILFLKSGSAFAADPLNKTELSDLFSKSKDYFKQANELAANNTEEAKELYHKSALTVERIIKEGKVENGKLYYNVGNAYYLMGDIGRAIVNYRRAEKFIPYDINLQQNLAHARRTRQDKIETTEQTKVLKIVFFWHYDLSTQTRLTLFVFCFILFFTVASLRLFYVRPFMKWVLGPCALFMILFFTSLLINTITIANQKDGVILNPKVIARKGNAETYQPSFKDPLHAGTEFNTIEARDDWLNIELRDGRRCWIPKNASALLK